MNSLEKIRMWILLVGIVVLTLAAATIINVTNFLVIGFVLMLGGGLTFPEFRQKLNKRLKGVASIVYKFKND